MTTKQKNKKSSKKTPLKKVIEEKNEIIKSMDSEIESIKDKHIKLLAEFDNFQRRSFKEKENNKKYQGIDLLKELLPAFDDINRAVKFKESSGNESMLEAIELINSKIESILKKYSIVKLTSINNQFNPNLHEALLEQSSDTVDKGNIIEEYESGYSYHDKIIRHAKVVVSKGKS